MTHHGRLTFVQLLSAVTEGICLGLRHGRTPAELSFPCGNPPVEAFPQRLEVLVREGGGMLPVFALSGSRSCTPVVHGLSLLPSPELQAPALRGAPYLESS